MNKKIEKEKKEVKLSLGLLTGYCIAGTFQKFYADIPWSEAFSKKELLMSFAGIFISVFIIIRLKNKRK
ncbi:hypothetical protein [Polaribacter porphyrae]|uniref:Uncharacterized protein n=1 Tax=Polaribacter porphyrae TaxID=1137780 RepID=A0A2S7WKX0_9FLAO|nr:hypothetical protein [Polaribacter porphyrae]PQJ78239.1 hypothetical protein BTO18_03105 [Polaribacter porphyrae]